MADDRVPPADVLDDALSDAEAAAGADDRWKPLLARVRAAEAAQGTAAFDPTVDALAAECAQVNEIVRRGGRDPASA